jgi:aryl-alcohol dehydrogenase
MEFTAALLFDGYKSFSFKRVSLGDMRPDEVLVRLVASGICHTDLIVQDRTMPVPRPVILGHEGSGIVERVGTAVTKVRPGDPVALTFMSCGVCSNCVTAQPSYCEQFGALNVSGLRGDGSTALHIGATQIGSHFFGQSSFAHYSVANQRNVLKVREDAPLEMIGPFGCGIQTGAGGIMNALKPKPCESVVVLGAGGVGLSAVMAAAVIGCEPIVVVEPRADRRQLAQSVGATIAIDPAAGNVTQAVIEATGGGARVMFDTSGVPQVIEQAIDALGIRGSLGLVAMNSLTARASFSVVNLIGRGVTIKGIVEGDSNPDHFIPHLVDLFMAGRFPVDKMMRFYDFESLNTAVADQNGGRVIKPILRFPR